MQGPETRSRGVTFHGLAVTTLASTLVLVALGGAVRATDSGLACPTWPGCFTPGDFLPGWQLNVWLEHTHRLVAAIVGLQVAALALWALVAYRPHRKVLAAALLAAVLIVAQGLLGAIVVLQLLRAELVTAHLGMAMVVLACLVYLVVNVRSVGAPPPAPRDLRFAHATAAVALLALLQILVGGHTTGIAAGLVFTDFPLMDGRLWPAVAGERELFHAVHRVLALVLLGGVTWLCAQTVRNRRRLRASKAWRPEHRWLVRLPMWAAALTVLQIGLGVANLWTRASPATVIPHLAVASWIWTVLVFCTFLAYCHAPAAQTVTAEAAGERKQEVPA